MLYFYDFQKKTPFNFFIKILIKFLKSPRDFWDYGFFPTLGIL